MTQVLFAEHDNVVEAIPPDRSDHPLRISVLPWRPRRDRAVANAHGAHTPNEGWAVSTIPIANETTRCRSPAVGLGQLLGNPFRGRMGGHAQPHQLSTTMLQNQKSI